MPPRQQSHEPTLSRSNFDGVYDDVQIGDDFNVMHVERRTHDGEHTYTCPEDPRYEMDRQRRLNNPNFFHKTRNYLRGVQSRVLKGAQDPAQDTIGRTPQPSHAKSQSTTVTTPSTRTSPRPPSPSGLKVGAAGQVPTVGAAHEVRENAGSTASDANVQVIDETPGGSTARPATSQLDYQERVRDWLAKQQHVDEQNTDYEPNGEFHDASSQP